MQNMLIAAILDCFFVGVHDNIPVRCVTLQKWHEYYSERANKFNLLAKVAQICFKHDFKKLFILC